MDEQTPEGPIGTPPWEVPPAGPPPAGPPPAAPLPPGAPGASGPIVNWAPAPAATAVEVPGAPGLSFADTASRIVAYVIDILILGIIGFVIAALLGLGETTTRTNGSTTLSSYFVSTSNPIVSLIYAVIGAAYFILAWSGGRRATVGQRLLHLQVGNAFDGRPLSTEQAVRRWIGLGSFLGLLAFIRPIAGLASLAQLVWIVVLVITTARSATKQGLHDRFANSAVVKPSGEGTSGLVMACLLVIGIVVVLGIIGIVAIILMGPAFLDQLSRLGRSV